MRLVMMGTGTFAEPTFLGLFTGNHQVVGLVTQPDRPVGQERGSTRRLQNRMKDIAQEHHVPILQPESINTPAGVEGLRGMQPDLLVVAAYGQILTREVLEVPALGGINVHASLLPKYRGAAPVAWAICHGETRTGVTIIRMSVSLDAGDILAQEAIDIGPEETAGELETRLSSLGARLSAETIARMTVGNVQGVKQDRAQVTKAPKLTKEHGLIDWSRTGLEICNHIRAMLPWPTAYTFLHRAGQEPMRIIVHRAAWRESPDALALSPGHAIMQKATDPPGLHVAAGSPTMVEILDLQPAGKRRMSAREFLRGHPVHAGDRFGPAST